MAIKNAYHTLMDPQQRNGYDSTVLTFDDSIPPSRSTLLSTSTSSASSDHSTDHDFYDVYGPVFTRNLRFDAKLRPEVSNHNNNNNSSNSRNNSKHNKNHTTPPSLGDATTPLDQVHQFYDYWIHFTSWRDFSLQATEELQLSDTLMQSESRYEKRYYQNQIDKRTKQLKRQEMIRIQTLVERAMEADPRLYVLMLYVVFVVVL
jgi:DnaJ homolog subfamily C member 2